MTDLLENEPPAEQIELAAVAKLRFADSWIACLLAPFVGVILIAILGAGALIVAFCINTLIGGEPINPANSQSIYTQFAQNPILLTLILAPSQVAFLLASFVFVVFSAYRVKERLALNIGHDGIWTWPFYILATPAIGQLASVCLSPFLPESESLGAITDMIVVVRTSLGPLGLPLLIVLIAVLPGICEELLFRGFTQNFLIRNWGVPAGIFVSSCLFAMVHLDPTHIVLVLPLGIWLGLVAWKTGSILPTILCHFFNNLIGVLAMWYGIGETDDTPLVWGIFGVCGLSAVLSVCLLVRNAR